MSLGRVLAIAGRILRQFRHDRRTLGLIAIVPLAMTALIGYLVSEEQEPLAVGIVVGGEPLDVPPQTGGPIEDEIVDALAGLDAIELERYREPEAAEAAVRAGDLAAAIVIPPGLTQDVLAGRLATIELIVTGIDPNLEAPVLRALQESITAFYEAPIELARVSTQGIGRLSSLDYSSSALIVAFSFFFTYLLTGIAFLRERQSGTLDRLMASPVTRLEVLMGYLLGFLGFAMIQALLILGYVVLVLDVRVEGSIWLVLVILAIMVVGVVNLGIALSFFARNELQVMQFIPLVITPQVLLGGLVWPVETLHPVLRWISQAFPITHAAAGLREVMIGGAGFADVADRVLAVVAFAIVMVFLGVAALRRQKA